MLYYNIYHKLKFTSLVCTFSQIIFVKIITLRYLIQRT